MKNLVYFALGLSLTSQLLAENTIRVKIASSIPKIRLPLQPHGYCPPSAKKEEEIKKVTFNCQRNTDTGVTALGLSLRASLELQISSLITYPFPPKWKFTPMEKKDVISLILWILMITSSPSPLKR